MKKNSNDEKNSTSFEMINLLELEAQNNNGKGVTCPKCKNDMITKKSHEIDLPKAVGFIFLLGGSFAIVLIINAIIYVRHKIKLNKLPQGVKEEVEKRKYSLLGLHVPTKFKIECSKCEFVFYENYDTGDLIVVGAFFIIFMIIVFSLVFVLLKF